MTAPQRPLAAPEEIAARAGQQAIPRLHLPVRTGLFAERSTRLRELAAAHPLRDFLLFTAELAGAQHELLSAHPAVTLPGPEALQSAAQADRPPLPAALWPRDPQWRLGLRGMVEHLLSRLAPGQAADAVRAVGGLDDDAIERQADRLLRGMMQGLDMAAAPVVAAGLQAYWAHLVIATAEAGAPDGTGPFLPGADPAACPCCGSAPVASVVRMDPGSGAHRYLACSLCPAQWHMVRIKCSRCQSTKGIRYRSLAPVAPDDPATVAHPRSGIEAETCDICGHYLKIVRVERDPSVEPVADDLASLSLDLLVSEAGFQRHGVNLMLLFGDPDGDPGGDPEGGATATGKGRV